MSFLSNTWYVAAWDFEVGQESLLGRVIAGEPIVLYRTHDGTLVAMQDRCSHRGAPLSMGRKEGDCLRCMYHGLRFDSLGRCVEVPGQARVGSTLDVRTYTLVEKNRWVWIWLGDPALAGASPIPDCFALSDPAWAWKPGYLHYQASHALIIDNLLDFSHLNYVHPGTLGGTENPARSKVERIDQGLRIERWQLDDVPAPFQSRLKHFEGNVDRWYFYDFLLPGILVMHSGVQAAGTGARERRFHDALEFRSCQAVTPESETTSHYFFALPHNFDIDKPAVTDSVHDSVLKAFAEDRLIIEAQQRNLSLVPQAAMNAIAADAALIQFRRLVATALEAEQRPFGSTGVTA